MKYIDADLLRKEIEKRQHICDGVFERDSDTYYQGKAVAYQETLAFIDSLQQEQPAKRGYKDCNGCEYNRLLKDQIGWQFRGCFGGDYKGKPIAEIELCPLMVAQQEQPSKELEAEIDRLWESFADEMEGPHNLYDIYARLARHFANWQKSQMLKDAVDIKITRDALYTLKPFILEKYLEYKIGKTAKLLLIQEDESK